MSTEKKAEHTPGFCTHCETLGRKNVPMELNGLRFMCSRPMGNKLLEEAREGAIRWINLYCAAAEIEDHECPYEDFKACPVCDEISDLNAQARTISDGWHQDWAVGILYAFELLAALIAIEEFAHCGAISMSVDANEFARIRDMAKAAIQKAEAAQ